MFFPPKDCRNNDILPGGFHHGQFPLHSVSMHIRCDCVNGANGQVSGGHRMVGKSGRAGRMRGPWDGMGIRTVEMLED